MYVCIPIHYTVIYDTGKHHRWRIPNQSYRVRHLMFQVLIKLVSAVRDHRFKTRLTNFSDQRSEIHIAKHCFYLTL